MSVRGLPVVAPALLAALVWIVAPGGALAQPGGGPKKEPRTCVRARQLMSDAEFEAHLGKMRAAETAEEREQVRAQMHERMRERAREGPGLPLCGELAPGARGKGMGKGQGKAKGQGRGMGRGRGGPGAGPPAAPPPPTPEPESPEAPEAEGDG